MAMPRAADAQRVLECSVVGVSPTSFDIDHWGFAADISGGYLNLLLTRPTSADPYVTVFAPLRTRISVHTAVEPASGSDTGTSDFDMATLGQGDLVVLDQWRFGGTTDYDQLTLKCPSHD
jgi:hypothetical protein